MRGRRWLLGGVAICLLCFQAKSSADTWSHEYVMPDGSSYLCGGTSEQSSCAHLDPRAREDLYERKRQITEKHKRCSKTMDRIFAERIDRANEVMDKGDANAIMSNMWADLLSPVQPYKVYADCTRN